MYPYNEKTDEEVVQEIISKLQDQKFDGNIKITFLTEQLNLLFKIPTRRRYSPSLLAMTRRRYSPSLLAMTRRRYSPSLLAMTRRRYSPSLLAMTALLQRISPACYKQMHRDNLLTLPSADHLRRLSSSIDMNCMELTKSPVQAHLPINKSINMFYLHYLHY